MTSVSAPVGFARWADDESQPCMSVGRRHRYWVRGFVAEFGLSVETMALNGFERCMEGRSHRWSPKGRKGCYGCEDTSPCLRWKTGSSNGNVLLSASSVFLHLANISVVGYEVSGSVGP
jgi:hypothetical protein